MLVQRKVTKRKHALVPQSRWARLLCAAHVLGTGADATSCRVGPSPGHPWPGVPCARCAARCGTRDGTSKATATAGIASLALFLLRVLLLRCTGFPWESPVVESRTVGHAARDGRVRGERDRTSRPPRPRARLNSRAPRRGDSPGPAFSWLLLFAGAKRSNPPPGRRHTTK